MRFGVLRLSNILFGTTLLFVLVNAQFVVAQTKPKVVVLMGREIPPYVKAMEGFKKALDCDAVVFDLHKDDKKEVIEKIKGNAPNLIFALGSAALKFTKKNFADIPVVFTMVLVPGKLTGNIAGVSMMLPAKSHLEGLKLISNKVKSVGIVFNPTRSKKRVEEFKAAGEAVGLKIVTLPVKSKKEAFSSIKLLGGRVDAFWMIMDQDIVANFKLLLSFSLKEKVPLATFSYKYVEMGALLALAPKFDDLGNQAGVLAGKIIAGKNPTELGVINPTNFYYSINVNTAVKIGVGVPPDILKKEHKLYK
jgi:putative ABC transport system substrate-binding protein